MDLNAQVYRTEGSLKQALSRHRGRSRRASPHVSVQDKGRRFNTDLLEAVELGFLLDLAEVLVVVGAGPQRVARRPLPRGLPHPRRRQLHATHDGLPRGRRRRAGHRSGSTTSRSCRPATARWSASTDEKQSLMDITLKIRRYNPEVSDESTWQTFQVAGPADRPGARRAAQGEVGARRHADLPPLVRARRLRLRRDADQRQEPAGLQDLAQGRQPRQADHGRADPGPPGAQGPRRRHGAVLRGVPVGDAVPHHERATSRPASESSRRRTATGSTTPPSASCAPRARRRARSSGPTASTSARRPSSAPTASSSTAATRAPTSGWRSSTTTRASGAAAPPSTAPRPARAASRSPRRSKRSSAR